MSWFQIILGTPIRIWIILAFLVLLGIKALKPRKMKAIQMWILPIVFFVLELYGIFSEISNWLWGFGTFAVALGVGIAAGWLNALRWPPAVFDAETARVWRPGNPSTLIILLLGFSAKYILSVNLLLMPNLAGGQGFSALFGGVSGLMDGAFWGVALLQYRQAFHTQ